MENVLPVTSSFSFLKYFRWLKKIFSYRDSFRNLNRLKLLQVTILVVFILTSIANFLAGLQYSLTITLSGVVIMIGLGYLIELQLFRLSRIFFFLYLNVVAFSLAYVEGLSSGAYFFYFLIMIIANFVTTRERSNELISFYIVTFACLIITFRECPQDSFLQKIEDDAKDVNLLLNCCVSFLIGGIISWNMMKDNFFKEEVLVSKQQFLDTIYNTSFDAIFIVDISNGLVTDCNQHSLELFEADTREEMIGKPAYNFFAELSDENAGMLKELLGSTTSSWKGELTCITEKHNMFAGYVSAVSMEHDGVPLKKINIIDISDIKKAKAELAAARDRAEEAFKARTKFLSNMSHELRTPLNGIIGTANLLMRDSYLPEQKQYFNVLKYSSEHMLHLINEILDFSKIEAGKMDLEKSTFNLRQQVDNILNLFQKQFDDKGLELELAFDKQLECNFIGDQTRLSQVLSNLISNAYKFTPSGKVVVTVLQVARNSNACTIRFYVQDSGIGIPAEKQKLIFESFTQVDNGTSRKFGGTGLGLTISSKIVELFGGKLELESEPGKGSNFYFTIQLGIDHQQSSYVNEEAVRDLNSLKGLKVLLAEDNPINMLIAKAILDKWEIITTEAVNGREAVEKYDSGQYDVLLLDLDMPELDGYEVLDTIRKKDENIPVIAFTAAVYENMQAHLINKGFNDYIQKPFRPEELHAKLARYKVA